MLGNLLFFVCLWVLWVAGNLGDPVGLWDSGVFGSVIGSCGFSGSSYGFGWFVALILDFGWVCFLLCCFWVSLWVLLIWVACCMLVTFLCAGFDLRGEVVALLSCVLYVRLISFRFGELSYYFDLIGFGVV